MLSAFFAVDRLFHRNFRGTQGDYWLALLAVVLPVLSVTPVSIAYTFYVALSHLCAWQTRMLPRWLHVPFLIYAVLEIATFCYLWSVWYRKRLPTRGPQLADDTLLETLRASFFSNPNGLLGTRPDEALEADANNFRLNLTGWFYKVPFSRLKRDNVLDWLAWSAYSAWLEELSPSQKEVCDHLLTMFEDRCGQKFPLGRDQSIRSLRITLDPLPLVPRPLIFYLFVYFFTAMAMIKLKRLRYTKHSLEVDGFIFEYYCRTGDPKTGSAESFENPLLFIHGLGVGLAQYRNFIGVLDESFPHRDVYILAQGQISMLPMHRNYCNPPTSTATIQALTKIADQHKIPQTGGWTVLSHSFGSIPHAWMVRQLPASIICRSIMVDPICFRLWESDVCYNFLYRRPRTAIQLMMAYFAGKELGIAYSLHRAFWWSENILLPEDVVHLHGHDNFVAFLGGKDEIINSSSVRLYLELSGLDVRFYEDYTHGQIIESGRRDRGSLEEVLAEVRRNHQL